MTTLFHGMRLALTATVVMSIAPPALAETPGARRNRNIVGSDFSRAEDVVPGSRGADVGPGFSRARHSQTATPPAARPDAKQLAALVEFDRRLKGYLALREELERKLKPLSSAANSAELAARQGTLATALRAARKGAKPGDIIPAPAADQIRGVFAADLRRRNVDATRAVYQEVPNRVRPVINRTMPDNTALATVPPLLLSNLPPLPDKLQYRFLDRHVVLMDGDTRVIVDYILNVLPPH